MWILPQDNALVKPVNPTPPRRSWRMVRIAVEVMLWMALAVILLTYLGDPLILFPRQRAESAAALRQAQIDLPQAEARWNADPAPDYDVVISVFAHMGCWLENRLVHVRGNSPTILAPARPDPLSIEPLADCGGADWLPGHSFTTLRTNLAALNTDEIHLEVTFDPKYGFVTSYHIFWIGSDGVYTVTLTDFHPVKP